MKNPLLYDTGSATPEWREPQTIDVAATLRNERNKTRHKSSDAMSIDLLIKLQEAIKSWAN